MKSLLCIDGGGMRGAIPARVLTHFETLSGKPIAELFDFISGTSTGGILALGLVRPGADGKPARLAGKEQRSEAKCDPARCDGWVGGGYGFALAACGPGQCFALLLLLLLLFFCCLYLALGRAGSTRPLAR